MQILVLGGQNPRHYAWVRQVAAAFEAAGDSVLVLDYANWIADGPVADVEAEVAAAGELLAGNTGEQPPVVVAKSIGTVIATLAIGRGVVPARGVIGLGVPLRAFERYPEATTLLRELPATIIVQNEHDPLGSGAEVSTFIAENGPRGAQVEIVPDQATHDYVDFDELVRLAHTLD